MQCSGDEDFNEAVLTTPEFKLRNGIVKLAEELKFDIEATKKNVSTMSKQRLIEIFKTMKQKKNSLE
jgi:hypothetical protein